MNFSVPVYVRSLPGGGEEWTSIGLGDDTCSRQGRGEIKVRHGLVSKLQQLVREASPKLLERLQPRTGLRLERLRLELTLRGGEGKRKATGRFPVVLEPRWISREARLVLAYHPLRQHEWFPVEDEKDQEELEKRASLYFQKVWTDLDDAGLLGLKSDGRDRLRVISFSAEPRSLLDQLPDRARGIWDDLRPARQKGSKRAKGGLKVLPEIAIDLTQRAAELALSLGTPRSPYREQLQVLLCGERPRSVLLTGPPRVGKTSLLHLAVHDLLIADGWQTHQNLDRVRHVWSFSGQRLLAGMSYLGDWEQRCLELLEDAQRKPLILLVEDLPAFGRLGRSRDSDRNLAEFFRGPLARGEICFLGECTSEQLQRLEDEAASFAALFATVPVAETSAGETLRMVLREARSIEAAHGLAFHPQLWRDLLELSGSLLKGAAFPGKALDLLRELQRSARRRKPAPAAQGSDAANGAQPVTSDDLLALLSQKTGLPPQLLRLDEPLDADALRVAFERQLLGQPEAVAAAGDLILRIRSGLTDPLRPYGVYLFTGPTGTGKTELAKCIAEYLYGAASRLLRFDMGEHGDSGAAARLIGDAFQPQGTLTAPVREQPFCVLLLDEIEKAHPSVLHLMLQLFDEGRLTDAAGNLCDFTHAVIIMTSNLGARSQAPVGFSESSEALLQEAARAVREFFPPELFNRIDRVVLFRPLDSVSAARIAAKELGALLGRRGLTDRNILVYPSARLSRRVVDEGFDARYGARPLKRYLEREVGSVLAAHVSAAPAALMQILRLYVDSSGAVRLHADRLTEAQPSVAELPMEPLLRLGMRELQEHLPGALDYLDELLASDALDRVSTRISEKLASRARGETGHEEALYNLEIMRGALRALRGRIGWLRANPRADRRQILRSLAEVQFMKRALERVHDPAQHSVMLELLHLGLARRQQRFGESGSSLLEVLARAYLGQRVSLEGFSLRDDEGRVRCGGPGEKPPIEPRRERPVQLLLRLVGLNVLDFFAGEIGCHVWRSLGRSADMVRVRVWPVLGDEKPASVIEAHLASVEALERALENGAEPLPENPEQLLPLVREYRFDPPARSHETSPLEVTDFALSYAATLQAHSLEEALPRIWLLRMGRREADEGASS